MTTFLVHLFRNQLHSNLHDVMHVATKVHVILRRYVVLTWMCPNKESI